jgi:DNA-binding response OmpR family regulator
MELRVLIVDDDVELSGLMAEVFALQGIRADACSSTTEALKAVEKTTYDAVVTDLTLAQGDSGLQLCRLLSAAWPRLLILVLSGDVSARDPALAAGARAFFKKPVELKTLTELIRAHSAG